MDTYKNEGFKVFSFIDDAWLAIDRDTDKGTLLSAEKHVTMKGTEDYHWDKFLLKEIPEQAITFLKDEAGFNDFIIDTKSITYVDINNRMCKVIRFIELEKSERLFTFYKLSESNIALDPTLSLNTKQNNFLLFGLDEDDIRQAFKKSLLNRWEKAEAEKREIEEQAKREKEKQRTTFRKQQAQLEAERKQNIENNFKELDINDNP